MSGDGRGGKLSPVFIASAPWFNRCGPGPAGVPPCAQFLAGRAVTGFLRCLVVNCSACCSLPRFAVEAELPE